ncbi:PAS domain-containing sensor histidine kinase [Pseudomonas sp. HR96]|uniref:PAS domain-containing sensor histidine kinase n=1 Tax=Pseudomonas sp. HR96 TaxID=1027966 RepID=UPI002A757E2B|nr:PAS domain-containing sensor histidine kinase [Pseudomonas sp. HR96]WPO98244.1 PAS domain-containing sensor histidine kinase [Pseudomonas sp. HR96]
MPERLPDAEALFEDAACGLVVTSEDGTILRANQVFCTWVGRSQAQLDGVRFQSLLTMGGRIFHQTHWAPLIQMQGSVAEVKLDLLHHDGSLVTMLLNGVRREHASGAYHELALFGTTDRDRYERELLSARQRAEELLQEKTAAEAALQQAKVELSVAYEKSQRRAVFAEQMVAIASHDLKNPLTAINMAANVLARGERSAREAQMLDHISRSAERAQRMIADLLDFALARVGPGLVVSPAALDLHQLVAQSVSELRVAFPAATLEHLSCGAQPAQVDADRIHQLIGNLVANSVAYGSALQPITITSGVSQDAATLWVHNHGPAIPEALAASLFEPMTRGSLKDDSVRSVGLGLFIVREIAKAHGGDVTVSSSEGAGTTFCVTLPQVRG